MNLEDIKLEYIREELNIEQLEKDPLDQFQKWMNQAIKTEISYPNAVTMTTVSEDNIPSSRIVLTKDISDKGITIYTDYHSDKGRDIEYNKNVSLLYFWKELDRQIRITGKASKTTREESQRYFHSRPKESQISAFISSQSKETTKEELYMRKANALNEFSNKEVPCPEQWGGYLISIEKIEFWQGRPNRLHDRFVYTKEDNSNWKITRLQP